MTDEEKAEILECIEHVKKVEAELERLAAADTDADEMTDDRWMYYTYV